MPRFAPLFVRSGKTLCWLAALLLPRLLGAQTLSLTNGVHTRTALTNTAVTLGGATELRLTTTNAPLPGSTVNLTSPESWLVFANLRPSAVSASYLGQVRVNGATAVAGGNVRLEQFGMGSVVIPHAPSFKPLEVFTGENFTGLSATLGLYTYHTNAVLGPMLRNIASFRLKRGYAATFARNADGSGGSEVFVAQDGDLDVGVMATNLSRASAFVRVFPWRWTGKKGWSGGVQDLVRPVWSYDWDNAANSTLDAEYIPMRHNGSWNAYGNINAKQRTTHALGFNEPDRPDQANMTVEAALDQWPNLLQSGLRVGAPAVSDSGSAGMGLDWLYTFMDQADARGYRVDFIPLHFYKCDWTASQYYNYLLGVYQRTGRPVWVTEFNNGANWCGTAPTLAANATRIGQFLDMLEDAPFVERYAIFNWVGPERAMVADNGSLTPAGIVYRDKATSLAYQQALPNAGRRGLAQLAFDGSPLDVSGYGHNAMPVGLPAYVAGRNGQAIALDGTNAHLRLPATIAPSAAFTFAAWVQWQGGGNWQRVFDFGNDTSQYLFLTPSSGSGTLRFAIKTNSAAAEQIVQTTGPLPVGQWTHVAVTLGSGTARLYTNGAVAATATGINALPGSFKPKKNFLGRSQFSADPLFRGRLDDVLVADTAYTATQIRALLTNTPPAFTINFLVRSTAVPGIAYSATLAGEATDPDGDALAYSKASGPAWLTIAADGTLGGVPTGRDGGTNHFTVRVADSAGMGGFATLAIVVPQVFNDGVWIADADGAWSETNRWSQGVVADGAGFTADFGTINPTADRTVTLDAPRTLGTLRFGDTAGAQRWTIQSSGTNGQRLDTGSAAQPVLSVTTATTFAAPLSDTNGFAKTGGGTLVLAAANSLSGTLNLDTASTSAADGVLRAAHPSALAQVTRLQLRNNNSGSSTLELDGANGSVLVSGALVANCRNNSVPTLRNVAGTNTLSGAVTLDVGGNLFNVQSDTGRLVLSGPAQYTGSLTGGRTFAFSGAGDVLVSGQIRASANGAPIALTKSGTGTLVLAAANTYTNTTTVSGGTLLVNGSTASGPVVIASGATLGGRGTIGGPTTLQAGSRLAPGDELLGRLTFNQNLALAGTVVLEIDRSLGAFDQVRSLGQLTLGGALLVTNRAGTFSAGDSFTLFLGNAITGNFASVSLPELAAGLAWDTNELTNGVLRVVSVAPPMLTGFTSLGLEGFRVTGTGVAGRTYVLEAATNLLPPVVWSPVTNTVADGTGQFFLHDSAPATSPLRFFRIAAP